MPKTPDEPDDNRPPHRVRPRVDARGRGHGSSPTGRDGPKSNNRNAQAPTPRPAASPDAAISSRTTDEEARDLLWLRRAKRGDDASFAELLRANDREIRRFVSIMVGAAAMDDVCRSSFIKAYRGLPLAPSTSPRIWLLGIADGACRDALRRRGRVGAARLRDEDASDDALIDETLDPEVRLVLALVDGAGLTIREAGRLVDGGAVRARELLDAGRTALDPARPFGDTPEHRDGFWNDLGNRLLIERAAPATPIQRAANVHTPAVSPQVGRSARGMARRVRERSPRTIPWRTISIAAAILGSLAVVVLLTLSVARHASTRDAELGLTASKVLDQLDSALTRDSVVSGVAKVTVSHDKYLPVGEYRFVRTSAGSYRVTASNDRWDEAHDQRANQFTLVRRQGENVTATVRTGIAPGPPEPSAAAPVLVGDLLSDSVRLVRAGTGQRADTTTLAAPGSSTTAPGDPAWLVVSDLPPGRAVAGGTGQLAGVGRLLTTSGDKVRLVASRSLVLPDSLEVLKGPTVVLKIEFQSLAIGQRLEGDALTIPIPDQADVTSTSNGFLTVGIADARRILGKDLHTPSALPDGFVLETVAVNADAKTAVFGYRNGSQQLTVTSRPAAAGSAGAADPFGKSASGASARGVTVSSGAFAGGRGWFAELPINHLWVLHQRILLVVAGDGSATELTKMVSSMQ